MRRRMASAALASLRRYWPFLPPALFIIVIINGIGQVDAGKIDAGIGDIGGTVCVWGFIGYGYWMRSRRDRLSLHEKVDGLAVSFRELLRELRTRGSDGAEARPSLSLVRNRD